MQRHTGIKVCQRLNLNRGPLVSEATDVTTEPLPVAWKTLVAGDEQLYQPQSKSTNTLTAET